MQKVISQVELNFWNWYIFILGQSPALRKLIPTFYRITRKPLLQTYLVGLAVAVAGFISGVLLYGLLAS